MSTPVPFAPGRGIEAMEAAAAETGGKAGAKRLKLADGESAYLRFITPVERMITMRCHDGVPTKPAPAGLQSDKWPAQMSSVCRYDKAFGGHYPDCVICDQKPTNKWGDVIKARPKTFAIACLRTPYNGRMIDAPREFTVKGDGDGAPDKTVKERALVVVEQAGSNFWDNLRPYAMKYGTLSDRDYQITRQGKDKDTKYIPFVEDKDEILYPGSQAWQVYEDEMQRQGLDLDAFILNLASDEYYARFFDRRFTVDKEGKILPAAVGAFGQPAPTPAQQAEADDRLLALRAQLDAGKATVPAAATPPAAPDPWATPAGVGAPAGDDPWGSSGPAY